MKFDPGFLNLVWHVAVTLLGLLSAIGVLWLKSRFVPKTDFDGVVARVDSSLQKQDGRLIVVEQALIHAPDKEDFAKLSADIASLRGELAELRGEQKSQNNLLASIHDHLLNSK